MTGRDSAIKKMAGYHQFHAVARALDATISASRPQGDRRVGVVWHTQGSGKSLTMAFYAGRVVLHPAMQNPTLVVLTDRNDLDEQLFGTFARCKDLLRQSPEQAKDRAHLRELLKVASGGVVFTTIQKFMPETRGDTFPLLSERSNIVVVADEAHRSQYDFIDGFARHMRDALPNASFIGFTGTPIDAADKNTRSVFGDYVSVYDIQRAVEDGATVPIYYESRLAKLELKEEERPHLDEAFDELTEGEELEGREKLKTKWSALEALVGTDRRVHLIAKDLVEHFEARLDAMDGKAMGVMGKGLALQFKKAFPENFASYERACKSGEVKTGQMHIVQRLASPRFIINFPTKRHWRQPSRLEYVRDGLQDLVAQVKRLNIQSIAVPPLGCGNGGLEWSAVRPLIIEAFATVPEVRVVLFEPSDAPAADQIIDRREKPGMTPGRAAVLALMGRYVETDYDYRLSLVEVQKLAYFLQLAGENLRLEYRAHHYGPYADNLRKALRNVEGHYTRGVGDGKNSPETPLELLPGAVHEARAFLEQKPETLARLDRVAALIEGFETPFGMELLGTVHWVMQHGADPDDVDDVLAKVQSWSERKRSQMKDGHVRAAWSRLHEQGWARSAQV